MSKGQVTSYGTGRSCSTSGCDTRLSIYNSGESCAVHARAAETARLAPRVPYEAAARS